MQLHIIYLDSCTNRFWAFKYLVKSIAAPISLLFSTLIGLNNFPFHALYVNVIAEVNIWRMPRTVHSNYSIICIS